MEEKEYEKEAYKQAKKIREGLEYFAKQRRKTKGICSRCEKEALIQKSKIAWDQELCDECADEVGGK